MNADDANNEVHRRNCWDCTYNDLMGTFFFGRCTWFEKHGKGKSKEIPRGVVDKGGKFFEPRR
jgi:hypothetical protein